MACSFDTAGLGSPMDILLVVAMHFLRFPAGLVGGKKKAVITACHLPDLHFRQFSCCPYLMLTGDKFAEVRGREGLQHCNFHYPSSAGPCLLLIS